MSEQVMLNLLLYILPYCPACGELSDMKVSTLWSENCSRIPRPIRPPCEYPESVNIVPNQFHNSFAPWFFKYYSHM